MNVFLKSLSLVFLLLTSACASLKVEDYAAERPQFYFEEYFNGDLEGWGIFQKSNGRIISRYGILIKGEWKGDAGEWDIKYVYSDGKVEDHKWKFKRVSEGKFVGSGDNVIGEIQAEVMGNALKMNYKKVMTFNDEEHNVDFEDWYWKVDEAVTMNRGYMSKFWLSIGETFSALRKRK